MPRPKFHDWPSSLKITTPEKIIEAYNEGYAGVYDDPEERGKFDDWIRHAGGGYVAGADVLHSLGLADAGKGKLNIPFVNVLDAYPKAFPSAAQRRGSCVAHDTVQACLVTLCCEVFAGLPDELSSIIEGAPDVSDTGEDDGVLSTEAVYWWRRHGGDGWSCDHAARVVCTESGLWLRKPYPEFGLDLTQYSAKTEGKWGAKTPPAEIKAFGQSHLMRVATRVSGNYEAYRDMTAAGVGISTCGGEGFSSKRDANGVSKRSGSWAHAMSIIGTDDRQWAYDTYGEPLLLTPQSWGGTWNSGPRDIHDSASMVPPAKKAIWIRNGLVNPDTGNIMIPQGAFWARWSDWKRRSAIALGGVAGWPRSPVDNLLI